MLRGGSITPSTVILTIEFQNLVCWFVWSQVELEIQGGPSKYIEAQVLLAFSARFRFPQGGVDNR